MARDELLRLTGVSGDPIETVAVTGAGLGGWRYVGADVQLTFQQRISAVTGTNPTLDTKIQHSAAGIVAVDTGVAFAQATDDHLNADKTEDAFPKVGWRTVSGYPYVRVYHTLGGTASPTFDVAVDIVTDQPNVP